MVEFRQTMDQYARDVLRDGKKIASIQWHPDCSPRIVWNVDILLSVDLSDIKLMTEELERRAATVGISVTPNREEIERRRDLPAAARGSGVRGDPQR